jgi:hypothetical protein
VEKVIGTDKDVFVITMGEMMSFVFSCINLVLYKVFLICTLPRTTSLLLFMCLAVWPQRT